LASRPAGVTQVTNPLPTQDADDPEQLDGARRNAPLTIRTLDRIVSLRDYEDFARAFAGVAKALAIRSAESQARGVTLIVAGPQGEPLPPSSTTYQYLLAALQAGGDPYVPLMLVSYTPVTFRLVAALHPDPSRDPDQVLAAVEAALRARFAFDSRDFGQAVSVGEIFEVAQSVAGVVAVTLAQLYRSDEAPGPPPPQGLLVARNPTELLTLDAAPLGLGTF
jgi:predicted phage baseplate assembly protein